MQQQDLYARLELIQPSDLERSTPNSPNRLSGAQSRLSAWGRTLLKYFLGSKEPQIATKRDLDGHVYYVVFDPVDRRRYMFGSEHEVRVWLEGRYYQ